MALQHLRSSTANKRPTPTSMADGQVALNTAAVSPGVFFKDAGGSLVKVGPVHVGTTAPNVSPAGGGHAGNSIGEQWLDTTGGTYVLKVWDGSAWRSDTGTFVDVSGDVMTGALGIIAGTAAASGLYFSGDTNTGIYSPGADQVAISTNGAGRLFVDSSGRVGVGTSSPAIPLEIYASGSGIKNVLNIKGTASTIGDGGAITFSNLDPTAFQLAKIGAAFEGGSFSGSLRFYTNTNNDGASLPERMRIDSSGRLGLGTSSPDALLTVNGVGAFGAGTAALPSIARSSDLDTGFWFPAANTIAASTAGVERLRIDSSGRLLVGTSSSSLIGGVEGGIQVQGTAGNAYYTAARFNTTATGSPGIILARSRSGTLGTNTVVQNGDRLGDISFNGADGSGYISAANILAFVDGTPGTNDMPGRLVFSTTADGASSPTERMRIDSSGRVGIGTTSPSSKLHVIGGTTPGGVDTAGIFTGGTLSIAGSGARIYLSGTPGFETIRAAYIEAVSEGAGYDHSLRFATNAPYESPVERARIDSSGRLLVGTSTAASSSDAQYAFFQIQGNSAASSNAGAWLALRRSQSASSIAAASLISNIASTDNTGNVFAQISCFADATAGTNDYPGRLVFSTTADGAATPTERLRITSAGVLQVADAGNITVGTTTGTKIGTATTQKIGFYNATPVVQPTAVADATDAATVITQLNALLAKLRTLGIIAT